MVQVLNFITQNGHIAILTLLELCTLLINDYINILFRQQKQQIFDCIYGA